MNPHGRPRAGLALAERIRQRLDPDKILDLAQRLADDESLPLKERLASLLQVAALGYAKLPTAIDTTITTTSAPTLDLSHMTTEQLAEKVAAIRALLAPPPADVPPASDEPRGEA